MTEGKSIINANLTPLPDKVGVDGLEDKWRTVWDEDGTMRVGVRGSCDGIGLEVRGRVGGDSQCLPVEHISCIS